MTVHSKLWIADYICRHVTSLELNWHCGIEEAGSWGILYSISYKVVCDSSELLVRLESNRFGV